MMLLRQIQRAMDDRRQAAAWAEEAQRRAEAEANEAMSEQASSRDISDVASDGF